MYENAYVYINNVTDKEPGVPNKQTRTQTSILFWCLQQIVIGGAIVKLIVAQACLYVCSGEPVALDLFYSLLINHQCCCSCFSSQLCLLLLVLRHVVVIFSIICGISCCCHSLFITNHHSFYLLPFRLFLLLLPFLNFTLQLIIILPDVVCTHLGTSLCFNILEFRVLFLFFLRK